jgi:hypothetical protein
VLKISCLPSDIKFYHFSFLEEQNSGKVPSLCLAIVLVHSLLGDSSGAFAG